MAQVALQLQCTAACSPSGTRQVFKHVQETLNHLKVLMKFQSAQTDSSDIQGTGGPASGIHQAWQALAETETAQIMGQ